jgi:signal transduction histidine kinase
MPSANDVESGVFRQELPAYPLRAVFDLAAEELGEEALAGLLSARGVTRKGLEDPLVWISLEFVEWLFDAISQSLDDPDFVTRAATRSMSAKYMGPLYPLLVALGTPLFTYRQVPKATSRLHKLARWDLTEARRGAVRLVLSPEPGQPRERTHTMCRFRKAQFSRVPTLFGLPAARVDHPECMIDGGNACVYEVTWSEPPPRRYPLIGLLGGLLTGIGLSSLAAAPGWYAGALWLSLSMGGWAIGRVLVLRQDLRARTRELDEHNEALDRVMLSNEKRYGELLEAKTDVDRKVDQRTAELRAATQRLSETLDEIQALDRAKTDFFNNVSHELRSPLTLILAPLEDVIAGRPPPGGERSAFESMHRNASRLLHLINQLLDLAKIDAGEMKIAPTPTDLARLVELSLKGFEAAARKKGVALEFRAPARMAPVGLDPSWIESAVTNLVANALRLTKSGGAVRVHVEDRGSDVSVTVSDDGPGIALEDQSKVFERFAQGDSTKRVIGGTGIGLALVREAARLHGGDVKLVSELGKGSTFSLNLPRRLEAQLDQRSDRVATVHAQAAYHVDELSEDRETVARSGPAPNAPLALVVEDNRELREYIVDVLAVRYRVHAANDGTKALALVPELKPDVIVSDVAMPEMDGYTLCRKLRAERETASIPILLVTARTEVQSVLEGFDAGANDYVLKPFHGRELLARVDVHVRLRRMVQEMALRERHAMLGVLAASVAHQVRNPLTTLVSGLPAMRSRLDGKVTPSTFELIDVMIDCAGRIERLTRDLMDLSRVDREVDGPYSPSDGLRAAIRLIRARLPEGVSLDERIEDGRIAEGRAGDINHVYLNLLDNALRAVLPQGTVRVDASVQGADYVVRVGDSGPGIDGENAARVFEPFFTTRPAGEGTGLGLAIARQVLQQCGGSIELGRSDLGGAEFTLHIPLARRKSLAPQAGGIGVH